MTQGPSQSSEESAPASPEAPALEGVDPGLRSALEREAGRWGLSVDAFVLCTLRASVGLVAEDGVHHDLDALAGVWSPEEAAEFAATIKYFEEIEDRFGACADQRSLL